MLGIGTFRFWFNPAYPLSRGEYGPLFFEWSTLHRRKVRQAAKDRTDPHNPEAIQRLLPNRAPAPDPPGIDRRSVRPPTNRKEDVAKATRAPPLRFPKRSIGPSSCLSFISGAVRVDGAHPCNRAPVGDRKPQIGVLGKILFVFVIVIVIVIGNQNGCRLRQRRRKRKRE